jgi:predicted RNA-binding protein with PUA-like domain
MTKYWLMKCEPDVYSIDDLHHEGETCWEGVRNYQARNFMRDEMKEGDFAFFYHSNAKPPGVAGLMKIVKRSYPDHTAWTEGNKYFDKKTSPERPIWVMVDVQFIEKFPTILSLKELREVPQLENLKILQKGNRLSITPVEREHFDLICTLARR